MVDPLDSAEELSVGEAHEGRPSELEGELNFAIYVKRFGNSTEDPEYPEPHIFPGTGVPSDPYIYKTTIEPLNHNGLDTWEEMPVEFTIESVKSSFLDSMGVKPFAKYALTAWPHEASPIMYTDERTARADHCTSVAKKVHVLKAQYKGTSYQISAANRESVASTIEDYLQFNIWIDRLDEGNGTLSDPYRFKTTIVPTNHDGIVSWGGKPVEEAITEIRRAFLQTLGGDPGLDYVNSLYPSEHSSTMFPSIKKAKKMHNQQLNGIVKTLKKEYRQTLYHVCRVAWYNSSTRIAGSLKEPWRNRHPVQNANKEGQRLDDVVEKEPLLLPHASVMTETQQSIEEGSPAETQTGCGSTSQESLQFIVWGDRVDKGIGTLSDPYIIKTIIVPTNHDGIVSWMGKPVEEAITVIQRAFLHKLHGDPSESHAYTCYPTGYHYGRHFKARLARDIHRKRVLGDIKLMEEEHEQTSYRFRWVTRDRSPSSGWVVGSEGARTSGRPTSKQAEALGLR